MDYKKKLEILKPSASIVKINDDAIGFILSKIILATDKKRFLHLVNDEKRADSLRKQLDFFLPQVEILFFPAWDCLPYDRVSPKESFSATRIDTLIRLSNKTDQKILIITTLNAALQKTIPVQSVKASGFKIAVNEKISIEELTNFLISNGYVRNYTANNIGDFAVRGNIVDIVAYSHGHFEDDLIGYRLDFFGDELESIKIFDPVNQISSEKLNKIDFLPKGEIILNGKSIDNFRKNYRRIFGVPQEDPMYNAVVEGFNYPGMEHWMPLFYDQPLDNIFTHLRSSLDNPNLALISLENNIFASKQQRLKDIEEYYQARVTTLKESRNSGSIYNPISPDLLYLSDDQFNYEIEPQGNPIGKIPTINFHNFDYGSNSSGVRIIDLEIKPVPDFALAAKANNQNAFELLKEFLGEQFLKHKILIACLSNGSRERLKKIFLEHEIATKIVDNHDSFLDLPKNYLGLALLSVNQGFYTSDTIIIAEAALFGEKINSLQKKNNRKFSERILSESLTLKPGELVVHRYHGIGKFDSIQTITVGVVKTDIIQSDFLKIVYAGGDNLFVPIEDINLISRYGAENPLIQLDKLGSLAWKNRKEKVRKRIKIAAEELIKIAAARHIKKSPILIPDFSEYEEFKARFKFVETFDQLRTIEEIEGDLAKGSPMDRLVCGDVGFGKTEVAMRAAFIAAKNQSQPFQVVIITPTTLLCRQHYRNFQERFKETGIIIEQVSRMVSATKSKKIKEKLSQGDVDIIIGTHALLSKNIKFKNLGLVIIDEEQHFGVIHKEKLKELKNEVHVLTLSATPIPRTLQMSLTGVKDLSIISTPPIDRLAIRSFVMPYDSVIVREAILREHNRGGKTFFVVPKIRDINEVEDRIRNLIPEIKIRSAHGQMSPGDLDQIMNDFYDSKFDVLLATTIIESGIDIENANTIIIHKAEMFGLAQLYQLRGRVGRGKIRAYAYIMTSPSRNLTKESKKKLEVMQTLDSLGVGFSIASHDMDIRGGGNILSDEQSGHVRETGIELYQSMLKEMIENIKSGKQISEESNLEEEKNYSIQIKLGISLLIPENYISDLGIRMSFYKKIGNISNDDEKNQISDELVNRFGKLPTEVDNLLEISTIKRLCQVCNIEKVESNNEGILIAFKNNNFANPDKLLELVFSGKDKGQRALQAKLYGHKVLFINNYQENKLILAKKAVEHLTKYLN